MHIQPAEESHLAGIVDIYNDAVLHTTAIWNDAVVDVDNRRQWHQARCALGYPVVVAVGASGQVAGYASFGDFRPFDGYRHTVEHSVYVHRDQRRAGIARALMLRLIDEARQLGKHVMVGAIESENAASIALHASLGFTESGRLQQVGTKFGQWLDLTWMQLRLSDARLPSDTDPSARPHHPRRTAG